MFGVAEVAEVADVVVVEVEGPRSGPMSSPVKT